MWLPRREGVNRDRGQVRQCCNEHVFRIPGSVSIRPLLAATRGHANLAKITKYIDFSLSKLSLK